MKKQQELAEKERRLEQQQQQQNQQEKEQERHRREQHVSSLTLRGKERSRESKTSTPPLSNILTIRGRISHSEGPRQKKAGGPMIVTLALFNHFF